MREGISGRHAVLQALRSEREVHSVLIDKEHGSDPLLKPILEAARRREMGVQYVGIPEMLRIAGSAHQSVAAMVGPMPPASPRSIVEAARAQGQEPLVLAVDGVEDPQNLGAIARSALLAGCHGLLVPDKGTARIGHGATKAAAGAFSLLPVAQVSSIRGALESLRREGLYILGADANGGKAPWTLDLRQGVCIVLGSEANGLSQQAIEACDAKVCLPTPGGDLSLNVSAAAAALVFETVRQRLG